MSQRDPVDVIVEESAYRWESVISGIRGAFCAVILTRLVLTGLDHAGGSERVATEAPVLLALVAFSVWAVVRARSGRATPTLLLLSVTVDAFGCFVALLPNVLWPWRDYDGILRIPDAAALLVVTTAAGFRLSPRAAGLACGLHAASASTLIAVDLARNGARVAYGGRDVVLFAILVLSAMALALVLSTRVRRLVRLGAKQQLEADRAKMNLWQVLEGNHEMRSALSAVALETELFLRAAQRRGAQEEPDDAGSEELVRVGRDLRAELGRLNGLVVEMRERAYAELAALQGAVRVDVGEVADEVIVRTRARFRDIAVERLGATGAEVVIAGGRTSLDRVLSNLIVNACEGDGRRGPTRVEIEVSRGDDGRVRIVVRDDGPGFPPPVLASSLDARGPTTKADGGGLGLFLVHAVVSATGGSLERATRATGGAEVVVELPGPSR